MHAELKSRHYRRSPLVQGGMEIACLVVVTMPATLRNAKITERYMQLVKELYADPKDEEILGSFITNVCDPSLTFPPSPQEKKNKKMAEKANRGIRQMFKNLQK